MKKTLRIATRKSPLALWQANHVKTVLQKNNTHLDITLVGLTTQGDREQTKALTQLGGKSLFVKELQKALLNHEADIAVHSIKDLSVQDCSGLVLAAICERDDPRDALLSKQYSSLMQLPKNAVVGTASPRRMALLKSKRPDLQIKILRGNVGTRIEKCESGDFDAILLAVAGLKRLQLTHHITEYLDPKHFIPAIGQAAIGIECREGDEELKQLLQILHHPITADCINAERAVNRVLGGDCHTPIAAYAIITEEQLHLHCMVGSLDGQTILEHKTMGTPHDARELGKAAGEALLEKGAAALLNKDRHV